MRTVIQRVIESQVEIAPAEGLPRTEVIGKIGKGLMVLVGIESTDDDSDIAWLAKKIVNLRVFDDANGVMNLSAKDVDADILLISQFTLQAATAKGNRPSYIKAAPPAIAIPIYERFIAKLEEELGKKIQTGKFGADMKVTIINDGPVTILIDSKNRE